MLYEISIDGKDFRLELKRGEREGAWSCRVGEGAEQMREVKFDAVSSGSGVLSLLLDGRSYEVRSAGNEITVGGRRYAVEVRDPRSFRSRRRAADAGDGPVKLVVATSRLPLPSKSASTSSVAAKV